MGDLLFGLIVIIILGLIVYGVFIGFIKLVIYLAFKWAESQQKIIMNEIKDRERKKNRRKEDE